MVYPSWQYKFIKVSCGTFCVVLTVLCIYHQQVLTPAGEKVFIADFKDIYAGTLRNESTCSDKSTLRGVAQKIVSFSYFNNPAANRNYYEGIERNARLLSEFYPGWVMRVYHDLTEKSSQSKLQELEQSYGSFLDFCYVGNLPGYGNLLGQQQTTWRFLTLADPLVDVTVFRDLDSIFQARELAAVTEWLNSSYTMHVMRDHPENSPTVLAGMWGVKLNTGKRDLWQQLINQIMEIVQSEAAQSTTKQLDQEPLADLVWPAVLKEKDFVMQHDSYMCKKESYAAAGGMRPFPTCRDSVDQNEPNFVGARFRIDSNINATCPESCRIKKSCIMC